MRRAAALLLAGGLLTPCRSVAQPADTAPVVPTLAVEQRSLQQTLALPEWLQLGLTYTAEPMVNPIGGATNLSSWTGQTSLNLAVGGGLARPVSGWREADHWSLRGSLTHSGGSDDFAEQIGALFPLQQIAYPRGWLLSEASLNRDPGDGWFGLQAGILPLNPAFITAPVFDLYVHSAFNDTLNLAARGLAVSPYATLGGIVSLQPAPQLNLRYGWFSLSSTTPVAQWLGGSAAGLGIGVGNIQTLQLDWEPSPPATLRGCRTSAGVVRPRPACLDPVNLPTQLPGTLVSMGGFQTSQQGGGVYGSATLRSGLPLGLDERLWLGGAWSSGEAGSLSPNFVAAGLVVQGPLPQRPLDVLILGVGRAGLNPGPLIDWPSRSESMVELGYQWQVNGNLALQPTVQWILNPSGGSGPLPAILAAGMQLSLRF